MTRPDQRRTGETKHGSAPTPGGIGRGWPCNLLLLCLLLAAVTTVRSETVQRGTVIFTLPRLATLQISGDVSGLLTLSADGAGESSYDTGHVTSATDATVLTVTTTDPWDLSAKLAGDWTGPGAYDKAETDLLLRISNTPTGTIENGASSFVPLNGTDTMILSDGGSVTGNVVDVQTRVLLDWTQDIPGAYSITVTYTLIGHVP